MKQWTLGAWSCPSLTFSEGPSVVQSGSHCDERIGQSSLLLRGLLQAGTPSRRLVVGAFQRYDVWWEEGCNSETSRF